MKDDDKKRKEVVDKIIKHIHPHDDEPDPTIYMGNYNFPQMFSFFSWFRDYVCSICQ